MGSNSSLAGEFFFKAQLFLRLLTFALLLGAILVLLNSGQTAYVFQIEFKARYSYSAELRFLFYVDVAVCISSLLLLFLICASYPGNPKCGFVSFIFWLDLVAMAVTMAGSAAGASVGYIAKYGQDQIGWIAICDTVEKFCNRVMISIGLSFFAFLCLFALTILSFRQHGKVN